MLRGLFTIKVFRWTHVIKIRLEFTIILDLGAGIHFMMSFFVLKFFDV